jgi:Asp-tRNA(Asn)/Glu-tRNA(Gln) amidotransferase A subunit family amidase
MSLADTAVVAAQSGARALQDLSAREIAGRIAARELSSAEVVAHFVARLKAVNGALNAVTADLSESAYAAAANVDKALARGEKLGPLAGLPVTIKECFDLAGTASTFGLPSRRNEIERRDDPYVAAWRAAGAIPIAKTNVPQLMIYTETDNPLYGRTDNPWDPERSCIAEFKRAMLASLESAEGGAIDAILCPAYALPAVRHGATELMPMPGAYVTLVNVCGFPAGIVPVTRVRPGEESDRGASGDIVDQVARETERDSAGLPIGVQVIARPWRDHVALAAMTAIEAAARTRPDYPARPPL